MTNGKELLRGLLAPVVTPMTAPGRPGLSAAPELLPRLAEAGVRGLLLLGSNGEGPLIPPAASAAFVADATARWRELTGGPVIVNITAPGTDEARARAEAALAARPDAFLLSPPTYFRHPDDEVVAHFAALAGLGVPLVAYNAPRYAVPLGPESAEAVLRLPNVAGIKDSSGSPDLFAHLVAVAAGLGDVGVTQGAEQRLTEALRAGADGIAPGLANIAPGLMADLLAAHLAGEHALADRLQDAATELTGLHAIRAGVPSVKELLRGRGLCTEHLAPPLRPCDAAERAAIARFADRHTGTLVKGTYQ